MKVLVCSSQGLVETVPWCRTCVCDCRTALDMYHVCRLSRYLRECMDFVVLVYWYMLKLHGSRQGGCFIGKKAFSR